MTAPTSRRAFLAASACAPASLAFSAGPALATTETPLLRMAREYFALVDLAQAESWTDEQHEAQWPARDALERAIMAEPSTDLRDMAAKILVLSGEGTWALPDETVLECARIAGRDFDRMPRCLFEGA